ncbi:hypothetical protein DUI87_07458 [Hirundo rustica rustica]|uniref:Reverse transcriptase domain-containing protein n=1 Tax=Hirundo rustica rustica TaxID=333673 RepID=A0A3M0KWW4_HIRRU|nr:hypothetical protein DUI87_07458 [Hirundo rustica rustica]
MDPVGPLGPAQDTVCPQADELKTLIAKYEMAIICPKQVQTAECPLNSTQQYSSLLNCRSNKQQGTGPREKLFELGKRAEGPGTGRQLWTVLEGSLSDWEEVMIVALAPVLFYVFINDLVPESTCLLMEFADDMVLGQRGVLQENKGMIVINKL